ncbi:MAG: tRNA lysidine(34) synthetase TilS [Saprospiraceae bacterium]|nr:tRNA lysidine(34) synthetase TilS [Saprospiraceae bacterium]
MEIKAKLFKAIDEILIGLSADPILIAVSGGVDSMVLADCLNKKGIPIAIAHCNYHLRDEDSKLDAKLVKEWTLLHGLTFHIGEFPIEPNTQGIQDKARKMRLSYFQELMSEFGYKYLFTAHHQDDAIENFLFRLLNGSGLRGLTTIEQKNQYSIKPFHNISKVELIEYAVKFEVPFREDLSNHSNKYSRNKIRNKLKPLLEEIKPGYKTAILQSIHILENAQKYLTHQKNVWKNINVHYHKTHISINKPVQLEYYLLNEFLIDFGFNYSVLEDLQNQIDTSARTFFSTAGYKITTGKDILILEQIGSQSDEMVRYIEFVPSEILSSNWMIYLDIIIESEVDFFQDNQFNKIYFDFDQIKMPLKIRNFYSGDKIKMLGMHGKAKKVKKMFSDHRVDSVSKRAWPIIESENEIIWIPSLGMSENVKITAKTSKIACLWWQKHTDQ